MLMSFDAARRRKTRQGAGELISVSLTNGSFSLKLKEPYTICQPFRKRETVFAPSLTDVEYYYD